MIADFLIPLLAARLWAAAPGCEEVLRKSLEPLGQPYEGEMLVSGRGGQNRRAMVRYLPPERYRRELMDEAGRSAQLVVSDGDTEWIYDIARGRVWRGEPSGPELKRRGRDEELGLLTSNYDCQIAEGGAVAGRPTWKLELFSRSGRDLSRRVWTDKRSGLVLKNESFLPDGSPLAMVEFSRLKLPAIVDADVFRFRPPPGARVTKRLDPAYEGLDSAKKESGLEPKVPSWLPSGYAFESVAVLPVRGKKIIHYRYSDGINALSLFQCPSRMRISFGGQAREKVRLRTGKGFFSWTPDGNELGWSPRGARMVLIGPLTLEALKRIAESIP